MRVARHGKWYLIWGAQPLPEGATAHGTVTRDTGETGALIRMPTGVYVQGSAGVLRSLPQGEVLAALARSEAAAALGSARSEAKTRAAKANRAKGGGWPKGKKRGPTKKQLDIAAK